MDINEVEENLDYIEGVISFLIRSRQTEYQLELNNLIARAFEQRDPERFEKYCICENLKKIKISNSITSIGFGAFEGCSNLTEVIFENPVGWRKLGGGLFSKIPPKVLADPQAVAEALTMNYKDVAIERV